MDFFKDCLVSALSIVMLKILVNIIVPRIEAAVNWLIKKFVDRAEKKISGSKMGQVRKDYVIKRLGIFGVHATAAVSDAIDGVVESLNDKNDTLASDLESSVQSELSSRVSSGVESAKTSIKSKISR